MTVIQFQDYRSATQDSSWVNNISLEGVIEIINMLKLSPRLLAIKHGLDVEHEMYGVIPADLLDYAFVVTALDNITLEIEKGANNPNIKPSKIIKYVDFKLEDLSKEVLMTEVNGKSPWVILSLVQAARNEMRTIISSS